MLSFDQGSAYCIAIWSVFGLILDGLMDLLDRCRKMQVHFTPDELPIVTPEEPDKRKDGDVSVVQGKRTRCKNKQRLVRIENETDPVILYRALERKTAFRFIGSRLRRLYSFHIL